MTSAVEEFLKNIGSRPLTDQEARELRLLRIKEGEGGGISGLLDALEEQSNTIKDKNNQA